MVETKQKQNNVWYCNVLKPLVRQKQGRISYRVAFARHVPQSLGGIPVSEVAGMTQCFHRNFLQYAPLTGVVFAHNHFIENLYRFGDATDPAVQLTQSLFVTLPGGEICPTHAGHVPGSHLSPALIGDLFTAWEEAKHKDPDGLANIFVRVVKDDCGYQEGRKGLQNDVARARKALLELKDRYDQSQPMMEEIKRIQGDVIKRNRHEKKRLKKHLQWITNEPERGHVDREMQRLDDETAWGEKEIARLRALIVPKLDIKAAEKILRRAQQAVKLEQTNLLTLADILARSFRKYEMDSRDEPRYLFKYATTATLLAFTWRNGESARSLEGYFRAVSRFGALRCPIECVLDLIDPRKGFIVEKRCRECTSVEPVPRSRFESISSIETAVLVTVGRPDAVRRPPVVPFSYITWAAYSEFPDCGETALRNLVNQLVFAESDGVKYFDHELLLELRKKFYPSLKTKLIEFYRTHPIPQDAVSQAAGRDWLEVTYRLNEGRDEGDILIRYRRPSEQKNIASPLKNLLRAFNALFGIEPLDWQESVDEVVRHINELRGTSLEVDLTRIHHDGFGVLKISDGISKYELRSYKPVHFGFVQTETVQSDRADRQDFRLFRRLRRYSCTTPRAEASDVAYFEQLMLASLFIPYHLDCDKVNAFFRKAPTHFPLLFADLNTPRRREAASTYMQRKLRRRPYEKVLAQLLDSITKYEEPSFRPPSYKKKSESTTTSDGTDDCTDSQ